MSRLRFIAAAKMRIPKAIIAFSGFGQSPNMTKEKIAKQIFSAIAGGWKSGSLQQQITILRLSKMPKSQCYQQKHTEPYPVLPSNAALLLTSAPLSTSPQCDNVWPSPRRNAYTDERSLLTHSLVQNRGQARFFTFPTDQFIYEM